jgi:hypothetical protein
MLSEWALSLSSLLVAATATRRDPLTVTPGMERNVAHLDVSADCGRATWSLFDPEGQRRRHCRMDAGRNVAQELVINSEPGTRIVELEWQDFTGSQAFAVSAESAERPTFVIGN